MNKKRYTEYAVPASLFMAVILLCAAGIWSDSDSSENAYTEEKELSEWSRETDRSPIIKAVDVSIEESERVSDVSEEPKNQEGSDLSQNYEAFLPQETGSIASSHVHTYRTVYRTIRHDAVVHTEQIQVGSDPIYEPRSYVVCRGCGIRNPSAEHLNAHMENGENATTYTAYEEVVIGYAPVWETRTVVDQEAWNEQVPDYEICSCGKRK